MELILPANALSRKLLETLHGLIFEQQLKRVRAAEASIRDLDLSPAELDVCIGLGTADGAFLTLIEHIPWSHARNYTPS